MTLCHARRSLLLLVLTPALFGCAHRAAPGAAAPLRVATSGDYAPFSIEQNGTWSGMDVEIAQRLGHDLGRPVIRVRRNWPALADTVQSGDADIVMGGLTMRPERALLGSYTRPYAVVGTVVLVRASDARRFTNVADLDRPGVRIVVNAGGHLERVARSLFAHAAVRPVDDNRAVPQRVLDGRADAAVTDTAEVRDWARPSLRVLGPFRTDHKAYLVASDERDLAERTDAWLMAREQDGWLNAERTRWLGDAATMSSARASREAVAAFVALRLALMPMIAAAKRAAGLPIEDRNQEEQVVARVRAQSSHPEYTAGVYRQLIALAKAVQGAAPTGDATTSLPALRDALARIDAPLVRELDRAPDASADEWKATLTPIIDAPGITPNDVQRLADILSKRTVAHP